MFYDVFLLSEWLGSKMVRIRPKRSPTSHMMAQGSPRLPKDGPKIVARWPTMAQNGPKIIQKWPQDGS